MGQVKIFGLEKHLDENRSAISEAIHISLQQAFALPPDKRFHRFISLSQNDFIYPEDRSEKYTIIEISIFEGRSIETKKDLIKLIFNKLEKLGIANQDVEITIFETPKHNWGIRGKAGDELQLNYKVEI